MSLIERERLLAEYDKAHVGPPGGARKLIEEAPEVKPKVVAEIKIDNDALQRMVDEAVEQIKAELFGNSDQLDIISRQAVLELPRNVERTFFGEVISETVDVKSIEALSPAEIGYGYCSDALLKMWIDNVITDGEYNRIMDKLNAHWGMKNG